jgi:hypothetical protein
MLTHRFLITIANRAGTNIDLQEPLLTIHRVYNHHHTCRDLSSTRCMSDKGQAGPKRHFAHRRFGIKESLVFTLFHLVDTMYFTMTVYPYAVSKCPSVSKVDFSDFF